MNRLTARKPARSRLSPGLLPLSQKSVRERATASGCPSRAPSLPHRLVRENGHPPCKRGGRDEIEVHSLRAILEEAPPLREQDWVNQDSILVNEVVFHQVVHEVVTTIHNQVLTWLLLELGDALRDIAFDPMGVLP